MSEIIDRVFEEAVFRLSTLTEKYSLNPNILKYFKEGKVYYSYVTAGVIGSIDSISYDSRYEKAVSDFEQQNKGYKVYHAIECGFMLSLLYVSTNFDDWESERLSGNSIFSYTINFQDNISEFGYIGVSGYMESGALLRSDGLLTNDESKNQGKNTKSQMVDFINSRCRLNGKKIPKYKLNTLSTDDLMSIINSSPDSKAAFTKYLSEETNKPSTSSSKARSSKKTIVAEVSTEKTKELWDAVNDLSSDPYSLLAMMKFSEIIDSLPYGSVSREELNNMFDKLLASDHNVLGMAMKLLKYSAEQASLTNE